MISDMLGVSACLLTANAACFRWFRSITFSCSVEEEGGSEVMQLLVFLSSLLSQAAPALGGVFKC